jgi:hypothetical protein
VELNGKCRSLRIFLDEKHQWQGHILYHAIVERLLAEGLAGATVLRGIEGYGSSAHIKSARWIDSGGTLPVVVEVVDRPEKIDAVLVWLSGMLPQHCLVTVAEVEVHHYYAPSGKHVSKR